MHLFLSPPGSGQPGPEIESLNTLRRGERGAIEIYTRAIGMFEGNPETQELRRIRQGHETADRLLHDLIQNLDGEPDDAAISWVPAADRLDQLPRFQDLVLCLREAEERGLAGYEAFLQVDEMPEEARYAVRAQLLPLCHEQIDRLRNLTGGPSPKG